MWAWEHCPHVRHVAKSDDNVVVDMDTLVTRYDAGFFWSILLLLISDWSPGCRRTL